MTNILISLLIIAVALFVTWLLGPVGLVIATFTGLVVVIRRDPSGLGR